MRHSSGRRKKPRDIGNRARRIQREIKATGPKTAALREIAAAWGRVDARNTTAR